MRQRFAFNLLMIATLVAAVGSDYLDQARLHVRAEAVVQAAERIASRFTSNFTKRHQRPLAPALQAPESAIVLAPAVPSSPSTHHAEYRLGLLFLPPPGV